MEENELIIDPQEVEEVLRSCLYKEKEIEGADNVPADAVIVEGINSKFGFHPGRLEKQRTKVTEWLKALPHQFRKGVGGDGWSFLNACKQENGVQWAGLHENMEQLFCLGMGLRLVECQTPREMWSSLPGGMPYYVINVE
ncbi:MAG: hypothetical protein KAS98_05420 [Deltaproteobacteria bacterium]|nr:hypothetical protein [Deltaproteobacteria bacterium]